MLVNSLFWKSQSPYFIIKYDVLWFSQHTQEVFVFLLKNASWSLYCLFITSLYHIKYWSTSWSKQLIACIYRFWKLFTGKEAYLPLRRNTPQQAFHWQGPEISTVATKLVTSKRPNCSHFYSSLSFIHSHFTHKNKKKLKEKVSIFQKRIKSFFHFFNLLWHLLFPKLSKNSM